MLSSIEEQGKLTEELKNQIEAAQTLVVVDDLYRPYRPKRQNPSHDCQRKKDWNGWPDVILLQMTKEPLEEEAESVYFRGKRRGLTAAEALAGAKDILAESISDEADYRIHIRKLTFQKGHADFRSERPRRQQSVYEMYYTL